ncbi:MAG: DNA translocase FtsK, partial [Bacteroidales bacterium]|nr:DNA translocase FtsK [Bacteroidales bacterium]
VVVDVKDPFPTGEEPATDGSFEIVTDGTLDAKVEEELPRIDNRDDLPKYKFPSLDLLGDYLSGRHEVSPDELERNNLKIRTTLSNYKIQVKDVKAIVGPTVTLYKVYPAPGVKIAAIKSLQEDIAMSLNARGVRVVTLPDSVGIEVANDKPSIVPLKSLLNDPAFRESKADLPVAIGYTITQQVKVFDLADAPHLLVAGATKQGKSVGLNVIVSSLLYSKHPSELKFVFIDPKMVEFSAYNQLLYHYLAVLPSASDEQEEMDRAIVKNAKDAGAVLKSLCVEMDQRYELLSKAGVNNLKRYNDKFRDRHLLPTEGHRFLPYIVTIIDEYADLTMSTGAGPESKALARSITNSVIRLAQKGRAAGLHVILATQRPTVDVVTGLIKTNFPTRIAFRVTSRVDSMTILDNPGADKLIGKGDMLIYSGIEMERVQCGYVDGDEVQAITSFIGEQRGWKRSYNTPCYLPEPEVEGGDEDGGGMIDMKNIDERFEEAARMVVMTQRGSTSDLQRKLGMGYAKAGRVMDQLEAAGVVGPQQGSKPREVLVKDFSELDGILAHFLNK